MQSERSPLQFWLMLVLTIAVAGSTFALGSWQMSRAQFKEARATTAQKASAASVMDAGEWLASSQPQLAIDRPVRLVGHWLTGQTLFLDNRQMNGKPGFYVLTPFVLADGQAVVVQRGWAPRHFLSRADLPNVPTPEGLQYLLGRAALPPAKLYAMGPDTQGFIRQNLELDTYSAELKRKFSLKVPSSVSVVQTQGDGDGLMRQWSAPDTGIDRHHGYAFQWFGLSALTVVLFLWFQIIQPFRKREAHRENPI